MSALGLPQDGFCGNGIVVPYGHETEMIAFGAGSGGACDLRTVNVAGAPRMNSIMERWIGSC